MFDAESAVFTRFRFRPWLPSGVTPEKPLIVLKSFFFPLKLLGFFARRSNF